MVPADSHTCISSSSTLPFPDIKVVHGNLAAFFPCRRKCKYTSKIDNYLLFLQLPGLLKFYKEP
jgi:hypothetical protein